MADPRVGRHDLEIGKAFLGPFEQFVTLAVAAVFQGDVFLQRVVSTIAIHLDGMVDDQLGGHQGVNPSRILPQGFNGVTHGRQIHHRRYPGEVLHEDARRMIGDLDRGIVALLPAGDIGQVRFLDHPTIEFAQQVLHQDADGVGQLFNGDALVGGILGKVKIGICLSLDLKRLGIVRVFHGKILFRVEDGSGNGSNEQRSDGSGPILSCRLTGMGGYFRQVGLK
ncbi:hypothetical protein DESC_300016 [Desulfosarcina cetonica]|nr:hypothetical protein DESC_300016 [Desulfosarcina cetonica]